jgi:ketosteroid isomerase-like protein
MALGSGFGQGPNDADLISDIEQQIANAWVNHDRAAIEAILAAEWSVTDSTGQVLTKEQVMQETFGSADRRIQAMVIDEVRVRTFGDTAVVTGRTRATGSYRGASSTVVLRFTDVFVRRDARWQVVASHGSAVAR